MLNGFIWSISIVWIHCLILQRWPPPGTTCTSHKSHGISNHLTLLLKDVWVWRHQGDGSGPKTFALSSTRAAASSYVRLFLFSFYLCTFINTLEALTEHHPQTSHTHLWHNEAKIRETLHTDLYSSNQITYIWSTIMHFTMRDLVSLYLRILYQVLQSNVCCKE